MEPRVIIRLRFACEFAQVLFGGKRMILAVLTGGPDWSGGRVFGRFSGAIARQEFLDAVEGVVGDARKHLA